jgi:hypothetical protein
MLLVSKGIEKELYGPVEFNVRSLNNTTLPAKNRNEVVEFEKKASELARVIKGTQKYAEELLTRVNYIRQALYNTPEADAHLINKANVLYNEIDDILFKFNGPKAKASEEEIPPIDVPINSRLSTLIWSRYRSTSDITGNEKNAYNILLEEFPPIYKQIKDISDNKIKELEKELNKIKAPYTPGNLPKFEIN